MSDSGNKKGPGSPDKDKEGLVSKGSESKMAQDKGQGSSSNVRTTPSRGRLDRQASQDGSMIIGPDGTARRRSMYRRMSSFDIPHTNSMMTTPDFKKLDEIDLKAVPWWTSQRFLLSILCFFGFIVLYAQRVNLSIAIVTMVDHEYLDQLARNKTLNDTVSSYNSTQSSNFSLYSITTVKPENGELCPELEKKNAIKGEFLWDKKLQGLILGAFFWGYLLLQVVGGTLSEKFGAKKIIAIGMFPVSVLNILSPVCARANPYLFLIIRLLVGVGESVMYPAAQTLWSAWAPPNERSRLIGFSYAGGQFGNALIFPIGGFLCAYGFDGGWPAVFYTTGVASFIWCVLWVIFAYDTPAQSKWISDIEKKYIQSSVGERAKRKKGSIPWKSIFTSRPMWAIIVAHACGNYGAYMLLTQIPTYMKEVLKFDIKANGVFSMLPYLMFWAFITISGMIADFLISREFLTVSNTRKLMAALGMFGPGLALIGTGFMDCTQATGAVAMLTVAVGLCGFHFSGYFINHGDIAPPYAGTLFGISNTAATVPGILAPFVVSAMTPNRSREEWQSTFYVAAAIYFFGALFYIALGQGEIQTWAMAGDDEEEQNDNAEEGVGFGLQEIHETKEEDEDEEEKAADKMLKNVNGEQKV